MKIDEIIEMFAAPFDRGVVQRLYAESKPLGTLCDRHLVFWSNNNDRFLILGDNTGEVDAFVGCHSSRHDDTWVTRNAMSWVPKAKLVPALYQYILEVLKKNLQSDTEQTAMGRGIWTKSLPAMGYKPMVLDLETEKLYDPSKKDPYDGTDRYCWVLSHTGHYPSQNLAETALLPYRGRWYNPRQGFL